MCNEKPELGGSAIANLRNGEGLIHFLRSVFVTNLIKQWRRDSCCGRYGDPGC